MKSPQDTPDNKCKCKEPRNIGHWQYCPMYSYMDVLKSGHSAPPRDEENPFIAASWDGDKYIFEEDKTQHSADVV